MSKSEPALLEKIVLRNSDNCCSLLVLSVAWLAEIAAVVAAAIVFVVLGVLADFFIFQGRINVKWQKAEVPNSSMMTRLELAVSVDLCLLQRELGNNGI